VVIESLIRFLTGVLAVCRWVHGWTNLRYTNYTWVGAIYGRWGDHTTLRNRGCNGFEMLEMIKAFLQFLPWSCGLEDALFRVDAVFPHDAM
jgi:hypothetical protein